MADCSLTPRMTPLRAPLLACTEVQAGYGRTVVLDGMSLTIDEGTFVGVIGPNAAGKSTLLRVMAGLLTPMQGVVSLRGTDIAQLPRRDIATQIALVAQEETTDFGFTVREQVMLGRAPHHRGLHFENTLDCSIVEEAMEKTDVAHLADNRMEALSGGERRRVTIARALAQQPRVLLLDEPTNHLDLRAQLALIELMRQVNSAGIAILLVSHDINFIARTSREVRVLHEKRFRFSGSPVEVITERTMAQAFGIAARIGMDEALGAPVMTPIRRLP